MASGRVSEEEVLRYMVKKAQRKALKVAQRFSRNFVWKKKIEREIAVRGQPLDVSFKAERKQQRERMEEIQRLKKARREQPAKENRAQERTLEEDDDFDYKQSLIRSQIRMREGRTKAIDLLSNGSGIEPCMVFEGLTPDAMEELQADIKLRLRWERSIPARADFWEALMVLCEWKLAEARRSRKTGGLHWSIEADVRNELAEKSFIELEALRKSIQSDMSSGKAKVIEYWQAILECIELYKAKARLRESYASAMSPAKPVESSDSERDEDCLLPDDEYTPRKPKYSNHVHIGYDWNKYNQLHYDHDNPPPKMVKGYKINVFYPDLLDKSKAPTYTIEKDDSSNGETCLLRLHAGPPYEDIAFQIVNKDWDYSNKNGFKCTFEHGVLQLHFNFKRYRYRR